MAWKPKTIFGKILKGAVIGGGALLGLTVAGRVVKGVGAVAKVGIAAAKAVKGTRALSKVKSVVSGLDAAKDKVIESAGDLITGTTKEQRQLINAQKQETKTEAQKLTALEKLVNAGSTVAAARAALGLAPEEVPSFEGETVKASGLADLLQNKTVLFGGLGLLALLLFLKKR